jgi:hypothetical protein
MHANMKVVIANLLWNFFLLDDVIVFLSFVHEKTQSGKKNLIQFSSPSPLPKLAHPNKLTPAPRVCVSSEKK